MAIKVNDNLRKAIRSRRIDYDIASTELSLKLGKRRDYISQLENGRIKKIERDCLSKIFQLCGMTEQDAEEYIDLFYNDDGSTYASDLNSEEPIFNLYLDRVNKALRSYYHEDAYSAASLCAALSACLQSDTKFMSSLLYSLSPALEVLDGKDKDSLCLSLCSTILSSLNEVKAKNK